MLTRDHGGGFSLDAGAPARCMFCVGQGASVRIEATDRAGLERLIRYCARPTYTSARRAMGIDPVDAVKRE